MSSEKSKKSADANRDRSKVHINNSQATRETFESIVIAVILAFLFRGFVAEAFVIPTGSMAPTLQGRHVDVECDECGFEYRAGASEENDYDKGVVVQTFCPICQYPKSLVPSETMDDMLSGTIRPPEREVSRMRAPNEQSFNGDRILVSKFAYERSEPERWDVIVFKYPGNAKQNYIKRLIGLPNEMVRIRHGDILIGRHQFNVPYRQARIGGLDGNQINDVLATALREHGIMLGPDVQLEAIDFADLPETDPARLVDRVWHLVDPASGQTYVLQGLGDEDRLEVFELPRIVRKPPDKQLALTQIVDDTAYRSKTLERLGWPERWQQHGAESPAWQRTEQGTFTVAKTDQVEWLRYRHIYPTWDEWQEMLLTDRLPERIQLAGGELITDYYTYNDRIIYKNGRAQERMLGSHWVGDLAIDADVEVKSNSGKVLLDLVEGGVHFRCTIDVATGTATLTRSDEQPFGDFGERPTMTPTAETSVRGPGRYELRFTNFDNQLRLWVDDTLVEFDGPTTYQRDDEVQPRWSESDPGDMEPAGIGAEGTELEVHRLALGRDVYYIAVTPRYPSGHEPDYSGFGFSVDEQNLVFSDPRTWQSTDLFRMRRTVEFVLGPDQLFPLGDNSPQSLDGRRWRDGTYFERKLLIGKAIFIYWPHSWRRPVPILTVNVKRMRFIR